MNDGKKIKRSKHEYSTFFLLMIIILLLGGTVVAITGSGVDGSIQFNDNGVINGSSNFLYDKTTDKLTIGVATFDGTDNLIMSGFDGVSIRPQTTTGVEIRSDYASGNGKIYWRNAGVNHGMTNFGTTDMAGYVGSGNNDGALIIAGFTEDGDYSPLQFNGFIGAGNPTVPAVQFFAREKQSTGGGPLDSGEIVFNFINSAGSIMSLWGDDSVVMAGDLTVGDINASTIYYDALIAKSPTFFCEEQTLWCEIIVPQYQQSLYVHFDENYNPQEIIFNEISYTPTEFNTQICPTNTKTQGTCEEIIAKWQKLKQQKLKKDWEKECVGIVKDNKCILEENNIVSRNEAIQTTQEPIYEQISTTCSQLNENLEVKTVNCIVQTENIINYNTLITFKDDCNWETNTGFYCKTETLISTFQ